ncbi:DUF4145 domain-containing protein [Planococcus sp. ANT_H30]|uniref:DUF4145 domain-containing protein n=1 Tax=Planococcus sp. ANT_H30 TaxID=2597347 RepID=UPI0011EEE7DE|nr:DUF4145 domain-containing protein [Planococcus sp. ANT_H30]KAA0956083.1 DUF4145 domain-containing protein [Planococcus sp. ANT_H30]
MNKLEFISSIINSIAWPIALIVVIHFLKKPLIKILSNLNRLTYNNLEMDFTNKLEEIETSLEDTQLPENNSQLNNKDKEIMTIAQISPAASITMSWSMVEKEIMNTIKRIAISPDYPAYKSPLKNIQLLKDNGKIDLDTLNSLNELRDLRNKAAHGHLSNDSLTYLEAMKYHNLSKRVIIILKDINR